jgi:hypothetical protein
LFNRQIGEKGLDPSFAHRLGVSFVVEQDIAPNPEDVGLLG